MSDVDHFFSGDAGVSATGDLLAADAVRRSTQRVLRRLLTNPGDYLWHPDYGAGLPARVGTLLDADEITGLVREQILNEASVAQDPEPEITVTPIPDGVSVAVRYTERESALETTLTFSVTP